MEKKELKKRFYEHFGYVSVIKDEISGNRIDSFWGWIEKELEKAEERGRREVLVKIKEIFETNIPHGLYSPSETSYLYERFGGAIQQYYIDELSKLKQ